MPSDVLITPATSKIDFTDGANSTKKLSISGTAFSFNSNLNVLSSTSLSSAFKAEGVNGTLFEVTDDLSNSLMSVNTLGGLPVFEVFANNSIIGGQYGANDFVISGNKIGLGYANPVNKLSVSGSVSIGSSYNVAAPSNGLIVQGNVGIGTVSPSARLTIVDNTNGGIINLVGRTSDDTAAVNFRVTSDASTYAYISPDTNEFRLYHNDGFMSFYPGGTEKWRITAAGILESNGLQTIRTNTGNLTLATALGNGHILLSPHGTGNVGIGRASPQQKLHIAGTNARLAISNDSDNNWAEIGNDGSSGQNTLEFFTGSSVTSAMSITNANKVGIGTIAPVAKLHIGSDVEPNISNQTLFVQGSKTGYAGFVGLPMGSLMVYDDTASTAGSGGAISFGANTGSSQKTWIAAIESRRDSAVNDGTNYGGSLVFYTRPAQATPEERMRITSAGSFRTDLDASYHMGILNEYVSTYVSRTKFGRWNNTSNLELYYDIAGTEEARITRNLSTAVLKFNRSTTTDMIIDGAGNVGIGVGATLYKLEVNGNFAAGGTSTIGTTYPQLTLNGTANQHAYLMVNRTNYESGIQFQTSGTSKWWMYMPSGSDATLRFYTNQNSAGDILNLTNTGNVGVGTITPNSRLHVYNSSASSTIAANAIAVFEQDSNAGIQVCVPDSNEAGLFFSRSGAAYYSAITRSGTNLLLKNNSSTSMTINLNGNVGVGIADPTAKLDVTGSLTSGYSLLLRSGDNYNQSDSVQIAFGFANQTNYRHSIRTRHNPAAPISGIVGNNIDFYVWKRGTDAAADLGTQFVMTMQGDGNVGIGITNPADKLHVVGNADIGDSTADTGIIVRHGSGSAQYGRIRFYSVSTNINTIHSFPTAWNSGTFLNSSAGALNLGGTNGITFGSWNNVDVAFAQGGNNYFKGNVGIGVTVPSATLHLNSTTSGATLLRADGTNGTLFSVVDDLSDSLMSVNNSAGLPVLEVFADDRVVAGQYGANDFVLRNNKLGLGTNNPAYRLNVYDISSGSVDEVFVGTIGSDQVVGGRTGGSFGISTKSTSNGNLILTANSAMYLRTGGSNDRVFIKSDGNVGIGNITPKQLLHINGNILLDGLDNGYTQSATRGIGYGSGNGAVSVDGFSGMDIQSVNAPAPYNGNYSQNLRFWTHHFNTGSGGTPRMVIQYNGNVGIGTVTPGYKLHVNGDLRATSASFTAALTGTKGIFSDASGVGSVLEVYNTVATNATTAIIRQTAAGGNGNQDIGLLVDIEGSNDLDRIANFRYYNGSTYTSRMAIMRGGNVGIGTISPGAKLDVVGSTRLSSNLLSHKVASYTTSYPGISSFGADTTDSALTYYDTGKLVANTEFRGVVWTGKHYIFTDYTNLRAYFYDNNFVQITNAYGYFFVTLPAPSGYANIHGAAWDGRYLWTVCYVTGGGTGSKIVGYDLDTTNQTATIIAESANIAPIGSTYDIEYADGHLYLVYLGGLYIYKWNGSSIDFVSSYAGAAGGISAQAITYDGSYLWVTSNSVNIYKVGLDGTPLATITTFPPNICGWAWNGSNIVAFNYAARNIYIINTARLRIDTQKLALMGGNVGIGKTTPNAKLNILSSSSLSSVFKTEGVNGTLFEVTDDLSNSLMSVNTIGGLPVFEVFANNSIIAGQYGQNDFVISGNKVGIGTASPLTKLHIYENVTRVTYIAQNNLHTARFEAFGTATAIDTTASNGIFFRINGSNIVKFAADGNVGIGTATPTYKLQIGTVGSLADSIRIGTYQVAKNTRQYIGYTRDDSGLFESAGNGDTPSTVLGGVVGIRIVNTEGTLYAPQADNSVQILTHIYNGGSRIALHAHYDGNVGIGTTSPATLLQIGTETPTSATGGIQFGSDTTARIYRVGAGNIQISNNLTVGGTVTGTFAGNITGNVTGNVSGSSGTCNGLAASATILQNPRLIGGVSFNGSADITLPGVNTAGTQNTSGTAASATTAAACTGNAASATYARRLDDASRTSFTVGGNKDNYYPVIFNIGAGATALQYSEFVIERGGYEEPGYTFAGGNTFSTLNIRFSCKSSGWGYGATYENVEMHGYTTQLVANWQQMSEASKLIVWLRGSTIYYFWNVVGNTILDNGNSGGTSLTLAYAPYYSYTYTSTQTVETKALYGKYVNSSTGTSGIYVAGTVLAEGLFSGPGTGLTGTASSLVAGSANAIADGVVSTSAKIANSVVTLAKIANISTGTILGNNGAGAGAPIALIPSQIAAMLTGQAINTTGTAAGLSATLAVTSGGTGGNTQALGRTGLGATTVGANLFTLANPSAIRFIRINADNTVSALSDTDFRTAIGAGTGGGSGTVTSISVATSSGFAGTVTSGATPVISLTTSITGILKGNGTAISAAVSGTDYLAPNTNITVNQLTATQAIIQKKVQPASNISGNVAVTIDVSSANVHVLTLDNGAVINSLAYTNRAADGAVNTILLVIKYLGTSASIVWSDVIWANGNDPTLTKVNGRADVYALTSYKGTSGYWIGTVVAQNLVSTNL